MQGIKPEKRMLYEYLCTSKASKSSTCWEQVQRAADAGYKTRKTPSANLCHLGGGGGLSRSRPPLSGRHDRLLPLPRIPPRQPPSPLHPHCLLLVGASGGGVGWGGGGGGSRSGCLECQCRDCRILLRQYLYLCTTILRQYLFFCTS
jgi:hypothetical protein